MADKIVLTITECYITGVVISKEIKEILTRGLTSGYAGRNLRTPVDRGGFSFESSHYEGAEGVYHDEWLAQITGGGQEVVEVDGKKFTRLYAGGVAPAEQLEKLGITKKDVAGYLKWKIRGLGGMTRLDRTCMPTETDGDNGEWRYAYRVLDRREDISLTLGEETIFYKEETVFIHLFLLTPVE
ncbi:hypothetical protein MUP46_03925 [Patescibacteria group bacterium]|nr:hypothetical protein [Patescibacteria group bacterium]